MLTPKEREGLEELNTDHHRRMALNYEMLASRGTLSAIVGQDEGSRAAIIEAMLGCEYRCEMTEEGQRHVLELGAGSGRDIDHLERTFDATYCGVEVVEEAALRLRDRNVHHVALEDMPADWNGRFHYVYSRHVMEHVINVDAALDALRRVLAPNGIIGAVTPHVFPDHEPAHVTTLKADEWIKTYERHGFRVVYCLVKRGVGPCEETHLVAIHQDWSWPPAKD